jgi:hypothetical protein
LTDSTSTKARLSTGNEFIAIPDISTSRAGIEGISFMYTAFRASIELRGSEGCPLLRPVLEVGDRNLFESEPEFEQVSHWVPRFRTVSAELEASATVFAPLDRRGFACVLSVKNASDSGMRLKAGWRGCWESTYHAARLAKLMAGVKHASISSWEVGVPVIEYRGHTPLFALALVAEEVTSSRIWGGESGNELTEWRGESVLARPGHPVYYELADECALAPGEARTVTVYVGLGLEEVSAIASAKELRLQGWERMLASLRAWLDSRTIRCEDPWLEQLINANSFYSYFFSQAIALDTEEMVVTAARSSRNELCAAYMDRQAMLWTLPAVLQVDWTQARKLLIHAFTVQLPNVGVHSRYIDGTALEPGLQLDQLCAPIEALHFYVQLTNDLSVLFDRRVQAGVNAIQQILAAQRHPEVALFETLLLPSGEPSRYPYVCYSNILVWRVLRDVAWLYDRIRDVDRALEADTLANKVRAAVTAHFVKPGPFGEMFALGVDLHGNYELGDDPEGSIRMATYYGFCSPDDPVYRNTVAWIYSEHNPRAGCGLGFDAPFACGSGGPSVVGVVNDLLTGRKEQALDFLRRASLDDGIACETVDRVTGKAASGGAYASLAGYLAFGLRTALNLEVPESAAAPQKRRPGEALYEPPPPEASQVTKKARL